MIYIILLVGNTTTGWHTSYDSSSHKTDPTTPPAVCTFTCCWFHFVGGYATNLQEQNPTTHRTKQTCQTELCTQQQRSSTRNSLFSFWRLNNTREMINNLHLMYYLLYNRVIHTIRTTQLTAVVVNIKNAACGASSLCSPEMWSRQITAAASAAAAIAACWRISDKIWYELCSIIRSIYITKKIRG